MLRTNIRIQQIFKTNTIRCLSNEKLLKFVDSKIPKPKKDQCIYNVNKWINYLQERLNTIQILNKELIIDGKYKNYVANKFELRYALSKINSEQISKITLEIDRLKRVESNIISYNPGTLINW